MKKIFNLVLVTSILATTVGCNAPTSSANSRRYTQRGDATQEANLTDEQDIRAEIGKTLLPSRKNLSGTAWVVQNNRTGEKYKFNFANVSRLNLYTYVTKDQGKTDSYGLTTGRYLCLLNDSIVTLLDNDARNPFVAIDFKKRQVYTTTQGPDIKTVIGSIQPRGQATQYKAIGDVMDKLFIRSLDNTAMGFSYDLTNAQPYVYIKQGSDKKTLVKNFDIARTWQYENNFDQFMPCQMWDGVIVYDTDKSAHITADLFGGEYQSDVTIRTFSLTTAALGDTIWSGTSQAYYFAINPKNKKLYVTAGTSCASGQVYQQILAEHKKDFSHWVKVTLNKEEGFLSFVQNGKTCKMTFACDGENAYCMTSRSDIQTLQRIY